MTIVEKQHENENYYISFESVKGRNGFYYEVSVCEKFNCRDGSYYYGHTVRQISYGLNEREKAQATFRRYRRKYV